MGILTCEDLKPYGLCGGWCAEGAGIKRVALLLCVCPHLLRGLLGVHTSPLSALFSFIALEGFILLRFFRSLISPSLSRGCPLTLSRTLGGVVRVCFERLMRAVYSQQRFWLAARVVCTT